MPRKLADNLVSMRPESKATDIVGHCEHRWIIKGTEHSEASCYHGDRRIMELKVVGLERAPADENRTQGPEDVSKGGGEEETIL